MRKQFLYNLTLLVVAVASLLAFAYFFDTKTYKTVPCNDNDYVGICYAEGQTNALTTSSLIALSTSIIVAATSIGLVVFQNVKGKKTRVISLVMLTLVVLGGLLWWYVTPKPITSTRTLEGTLQYVNCNNAGVGCTPWVLKLHDGKTQSLGATQDISANLNKEVRVTGTYVEGGIPSGATFFEVQSIEMVE